VPVMVCPYTTDVAMDMIQKFTPKLNVSDVARVDAAVDHYEEFIDFEGLLERTGNGLD